MEDDGTFQDVAFVPGLLCYHQYLPGYRGMQPGVIRPDFTLKVL